MVQRDQVHILKASVHILTYHCNVHHFSIMFKGINVFYIKSKQWAYFLSLSRLLAFCDFHIFVDLLLFFTCSNLIRESNIYEK